MLPCARGLNIVDLHELSVVCALYVAGQFLYGQKEISIRSGRGAVSHSQPNQGVCQACAYRCNLYFLRRFSDAVQPKF